ncbi:sulfurtransferase [Cohaesibacter gelatinilyticus]|nr:sulfurtransferase [Cohaesibacter gelatinilyticus]
MTMSFSSSRSAFARTPSTRWGIPHTLFMLLTAIFLIASVDTIRAEAAQPLVSAKWLSENLDASSIRILDLQSPQGYARAHIKGAVNTSYAQWRRTDANGLPKMLPDLDYLQSLIGTLGIEQGTHVILAPIGISASEVAVATRVYWTFKTLGHDKVSILNGGLIAYSKLSDAKFVTEPTTVSPTTYNASLNKDMAPNGDEVNFAWKQGVVMVDSRSEDEYLGKVAGPGQRAGTIPDSRFMPFDRLLEKDGQSFRFPEVSELKSIYEKHKVPTSGRQISFCHTGHRTSLTWFVSHELLGNKDAKLYDASMAEWAKRQDLPIAKPK